MLPSRVKHSPRRQFPTAKLSNSVAPETSGLLISPIASELALAENSSVLDRAAIGLDASAMRQTFLQAIPIFAGLTPAALTEIASATEEAVFHKDDIIVREGEPGNRMFIISQGSVEIVKYLGRPQETVLAILLPRDFLGEMSIIDSVVRSASVRAVEETTLFALRGIDLYHLFQKHPDQYAIVILNIARDISRRLRMLDERFAAISH
jgi:CRP/FNR family cyclic AMP-dependent transcriptional regulator